MNNNLIAAAPPRTSIRIQQHVSEMGVGKMGVNEEIIINLIKF
jgi:hypothetical protein